MSIFTILIILAMIISTINDLATKKRQEEKRNRPTGEEDQVQKTQPETKQESAQILIPDELWTILTGEEREPQPIPSPEPIEEEYDPEPSPELHEWQDGTPEWELDPIEEPVSLESYTPESYTPADLTRTVEREKASLPTYTPRREPRRRTTPRRLRRLRRAIVMKEILGTPKGLEELV